MEPKLFTLAEAERALGPLRPKVEALCEAVQQLRDASAQLSVLVHQHGEAGVDQPDNPDRERYWQLVEQARDAEERVQALLDEIRFTGAEVKDLDLGLLDFPARRGGEVVCLCWKLGEERIAHWHGLQEGFAGRKPLAELEQRR